MKEELTFETRKNLVHTLKIESAKVINEFLLRKDNLINVLEADDFVELLDSGSKKMREIAVARCTVNEQTLPKVIDVIRKEEYQSVISAFLLRDDEAHKKFSNNDIAYLCRNSKFFEQYKQIIKIRHANEAITQLLPEKESIYDVYATHLKEYDALDNKEKVYAEDLADMLKNQAFGAELELDSYCNIVADIVADATGGIKNPKVLDDKDTRKVNIHDKTGKIWGIDRDESVPDTGAEIVTPRLFFDELSELENVINSLKKNNIMADSHCGLHVHVDGAKFDNLGDGLENPLNRLLANFFVNQDIIYKALGVSYYREGLFAKMLKGEFIDRMLRAKTPGERREIWYEDWHPELQDERSVFSFSRYRGVNLNCYFDKGSSIEFRLFNMPFDLDVDIIKANVHFTIAFAFASQNNLCMPSILQKNMSPRDSMNAFLCSIGLIGDEFAKTREILTKNLSTKVIENSEYFRHLNLYEKYLHGREIVLPDVQQGKKVEITVNGRIRHGSRFRHFCDRDDKFRRKGR